MYMYVFVVDFSALHFAFCRKYWYIVEALIGLNTFGLDLSAFKGGWVRQRCPVAFAMGASS